MHQDIAAHLMFQSKGLLPRQHTSSAPKTTVEIDAGHGHAAKRLSWPFIVRNLTSQRMQSNWAPFGELLRLRGIPLASTASDFETLSAAEAPLRFGRRLVDAAFDPLEVGSADFLELDCRDASARWAWPEEICTAGGIDAAKLSALVAATQAAAGFATPIGLVCPLNASSETIRICVEGQVNFLTFVGDPGQTSALGLVHSVARAREICTSLGRPLFPLVVDAPIESAREAVVLLALGASVVSCDRLLAALFPPPAKRREPAGNSNLLSSLGAIPGAPKKISLAILDAGRVLDELSSELVSTLNLCGVRDVAEFNREVLRATSASAASAAQVALMTDSQ